MSFAFVDRASVAAIKGTCKRLRNAADSESVWKKISVVNGTNLNLDAVALKEIKCSGTEGTCMMVEEKGTKTMFALKRARPFDEVRTDCIFDSSFCWTALNKSQCMLSLVE